MKCTTYTWRSWLWQQAEFSADVTDLAPGIRPFLDGPFKPVLQVCAENAFWQLPRLSLVDLCRFLDVEVGDGWKTYDLVYHLCKFILKKSDGEVVDVCHQRLVEMNDDADFAQELLQIDAAVECLDMHDHTVVYQQQHSARVAE
eukprot:6418640-Alexandrium_andersonii.AAC.1